MYKCLKRFSIEDSHGYQLVFIRLQDIEKIRQWRNAQQDVLRQKELISVEQQQNYFKTQVWPSFEETHPKQILFSFLLNDECIGYGGLTNIDWENQRAELSFLLDPKRIENHQEYAKDFFHFLSLLCRLSFEDLNFHRLYTETFAFRLQHMQVLEDNGFKVEGTLREHVYKQDRWWDSIIHGKLKTEWIVHAK